MKLNAPNFDELNYLLFENENMEQFISIAAKQCFTRLQKAAIREQLIAPNTVSTTLNNYLNLLKHTLKESNSQLTQWHSLHYELEESIANQTLALAYYTHWQYTLKQQTKNHNSLWSWLNEKHDQQQLLMFLEQWGCQGHPYHPNFRAKIGFNRCDVVSYCPEFNAEVTLHWIALHRSIAFTSVDATSYQLIFMQHFPKEYHQWNQALRLKQLNPDSYLPLPVHPWQWENTLKQLCAPLISSQQIVLIPQLQKTKPTMSFRTMMPYAHHSPHLKLATAIQATSSLRTISPSSVSNSSVLSNWLDQLLVQQHYYGKRLFLARDLAGINMLHSSITEEDRKQIGMIIRENPLQPIKETRQLVPLAALFGMSPVTQTPLLIEIIKSSNLDPETYFNEYCLCVLKSQLHLLMHYGVALEAHQQNTLVIFQDNRPMGLVIRDLGGIKICFNSLYQHVKKPALHPDSTITCTELKPLANTFIHTTLLSNLAPWIECLHEAYGLSPKNLWRQVSKIIHQLMQNDKAELNPIIYDWYQQRILFLPWQQKSLLTMRLHKNPDTDLFYDVANPLCESHG